MNNDIPRLNVSAKNQKNHANIKRQLGENCTQNDCVDNYSMKNSMDYLNSIGHAQVNMNNSNPSQTTIEAVEEFNGNPDLIKAQVDFCDELVKAGYPLENAISKTDAVFQVLKDGNTYPKD